MVIIKWQALCMSPNNLSFATPPPHPYFQLGKLRPRRLAVLQQVMCSEELRVPFRQRDPRKGRDGGLRLCWASGEGLHVERHRPGSNGIRKSKWPHLFRGGVPRTANRWMEDNHQANLRIAQQASTQQLSAWMQDDSELVPMDAG